MTLSMRLPLLTAFAAMSVAGSLSAQKVYTAQDYAQAERWMSYNVNPLIAHTPAGFTFLPDGRVFYRDTSGTNTAYMIADPAKGTAAEAFDGTKLAAALSTASGRRVSAARLAITSYTSDADLQGFIVESAGGQYHCNLSADTCTSIRPAVQTPVQSPNGQPPAGTTTTQAAGGNAQMRGRQNARGQASATQAEAPPVGRGRAAASLSPDKKSSAFIRDWNLWIRDEATGKERQLTTDGVTDFGYATNDAGWSHSNSAVLLWSADSKKIATFQQDQRKTGYMYTVSVNNRHPELTAWKYPLLGDKDITMIQRVVIDVDSGNVLRLKMPPDQHRSTLCDDIACRGGSGWEDTQFSPDNKHLAFVSTSRDHKDEWLRVADLTTGEIREVYHEHVPTYYEAGEGRINWKYLANSNEFIWYSERSNYGQLYLYDLTTGKLKNEITHGDGPVNQVLQVDEKNRVVYFVATGKEKGVDPYFSHYYRVGFDGKNQQLLTPENADHAITPSTDGKFFVDSYSTMQTPHTTVLRDNTGKVLVTLPKQDISKLLATGWKPAESITVTANDGKTPLYGYLWKPTTFDASKKYPIIDYVYPGPQTGSCRGRGFSAASGDNQSLADLGFVVVCIDGMGTPWRSKAFHDFHASSPEMMGEGTIPDQVAGIKELAAKNSWIDVSHVGIWGHSGGGNATASAMFHFPDFFQVGIAESGNHDQREYEDDWDEKYGGLEVIGPDGKSNYDAQANAMYAKNLKGHLLLAHGTADDNVPVNNTLNVVDALIKANKDFDLLLIPNAHHGYGDASQYMMRRRWDYFVRYLANGTTPVNYEPKSAQEVQRLAAGPFVDTSADNETPEN